MIYFVSVLIGFVLGHICEGLFSGHIYGPVDNEFRRWGLSSKNYIIAGDKSVDPYHLQGMRARLTSLGLIMVVILVILAPGSPLSNIIYSLQYNFYLFLVLVITGVIVGNLIARRRNRKMYIKYNSTTHQVVE